MNSQQNEMTRCLGFRESLALVIGTIIGTGIFMKTAVMSQTVGSPSMVLYAWIFGGLLSLAGALTYAELGSLFPKAGGEFVYLRETYGPLPSFLYGWMRFWIGSPGSIAAYAVGAATFLSPLFNGFDDATRILVAIGFVLAFSFVNCLNVTWGGRVQVIMTALKVLMIGTIVAGCFFLTDGGAGSFATPTDWEWKGWSAFGAAVIAALWAYDGWNNLPMASGEVKDAQKNVPKALIWGTLLILVIYGAVNLAYFHALPFEEVLSSNSPSNRSALPVATKAAQMFLGVGGVVFLSVAFVISALGAMNGSILTAARVPYAMAKDGVFFNGLAYLHPVTKSPIVAIVVQAVWACVLAISGTFDQLTDYVVFGSWVFYALCAAAVIVLRVKKPEAERAYRVPLYPIVPVVFVAVAIWLLLNTLIMSPRESGIGLLIIGCGVPAYWFFFRAKKVV
ncbi:MAG TPA: amino acid permease [Bdellovibrionales bacterium]|nr:amino acid permease [Bdellovibrionales bacterium]